MTATHTSTTTNADAIGRFVTTIGGRNFPLEVLDAARMALVDSIGVAIGGHGEDVEISVRKVAERWGTTGTAQIIMGGKATSAAAAMVNATMGHALDYDDTHVGAVAHLSNPIWAAALAVGANEGASERDILNAYIAGFEVGARVGGDGFGSAANMRGLHSTGVFGCLAAAVAAGVLLGLDEDGMASALGAAATQTSGLTASFGTMSKPFHAGKAALNGVLSAELARDGFVAATDLLEAEGGLAKTLIQDGSIAIKPLDFSQHWELTRNTFKPYAACLLTHPVIDAARALADQAKNRDIAEIHVDVNPACIKLAGKPHPTTGLEGKFSAAYCTALALTGHRATSIDFTSEQVNDPELQSLLQRVRLSPDDAMDMRSAHMRIDFTDGEPLEAHTDMALGNPSNPMDWADMRRKFMAMVEPVLGAESETLFDLLRNFGEDGQLEKINGLLSR
ncbi:MAG: MmgE/PrpD family protein [Rhodospirillaceae bacterium]|jgi:2-methylcitrate dehydratase PrpD|nr:MmgE/PrpD family protein [Rhodospirillaceae bacterium]MBT5808791.1 MmgE/PrpD family protein [Rhodospirillaceae bacterium]